MSQHHSDMRGAAEDRRIMRGRGRVGLLIGAFVAVLLVLALGVGYFAAGVAVAANDRAEAEKVVSEAVKDNDRIYVLLKNSPDIPTSFNTPDDFAKAKAATDDYGAKATQSRGIIDTNLPRLRQASANVLPVTHGVQAVRLALSGAPPAAVLTSALLELVVGAGWLLVALVSFNGIAERGRTDGSIELV